MTYCNIIAIVKMSSIVTLIFGELPCARRGELQTSEQQIWCFVPHLIAVILSNLE